MEQKTHSALHARRLPTAALALVAVLTWGLTLLALWFILPEELGVRKRLLIPFFSAVLLSIFATYTASAWCARPLFRRGVPAWAGPIAAGGMALLLYLLAYAILGVYPMGHESVLVVDMHHQYAPLLSELRDMLLHGGDFTYSFHIGLGSSFLPAFAYYLASPLNLLLLPFPEIMLTEAIFVITLVKGAVTAATFTACAQYLCRRRTAGTVAVGVLYALSGYMLAYSWNIMWLDVVALLPVVVLCMEHMLRTGRIVPYAILLALALYVNYYIGFMLCVFLVLYMAVWLFRKPRSLRERAVGCGRFALGSLLGGGLAACLLLPAAMALGRTSAAGGGLGEFDSNFPLFDLLGRLFYGATPTIRSGNLPNLYCGLPAVLLLPVYLANRQIPLRRRLCYGGLLAVLLLSCTITQWDLVWHGLHAPNDLPYRFSFLVSFVMLLMAAQVLTHPEHITSRQVVAGLAGCAAYLVLWERLDAETAPSPEVLYLNLLLLLVYGGILLATAYRRMPRRMTARLMLLVVGCELMLGAGKTLTTINDNEYYTNHTGYIANSQTAANVAAIDYIQELAQQELGDQFYRMEYLPRSTCMDPVLHHYNGLSTFASSNPYQTTRLLGDLGYAINGVNSYLYHSFVPATDALLNIRYVALEANITSHPQLEQVGQVTEQGLTRYIYRNRLALPLGYMVNDAVRNYRTSKYDPFESQEWLYRAMTGESVELYDVLSMSTLSDGAYMNNSSSFYVPGGEEEAEFYVSIEEEGQYFAFVDCRAANDISVLSYHEDGQVQNTWSVTNYEPYIIDMGTLTPGESAQVWVTSDAAATGNIYIARLNSEEMERCLTALQAGGLTVTQQKDGYICGTVNAAADGPMLFSIPYDAGWTVAVDGQPVETFPLAATDEGDDGALLCAAIPAGQHTVELTFRTPGMTVGLVVSLCSALALVALALLPRLCRRKNKPATAPVAPLPEADLPTPDTAAEASDPEPDDANRE